jgi:beta-lactam-binding protein with PASTA domain
VDAPNASDPTGPIQGKAIGPIRPGLYPDFVGADLASSLSVLNDNGMNFVIIEVHSDSVPQGLVINQKPGPGANASEDSAITLTVSKGSASSQ